jgi:hypothetical protein
MGASHFGGAGPLHGLRLSCIMWAMIFVYQKGMLMTRLGKIARLPREMREELNVRLRLASAFAKATADKPTRQVRLHNGEVGVASGQWTVDSGWWREGSGKTVRSNPVKAGQTGSNPVKAGQTGSNPVKARQTSQSGSNPVKIRDSQESEQIKSGPLCGLLAPPETVRPGQTQSKPVKPGQTGSNHQPACRRGL